MVNALPSPSSGCSWSRPATAGRSGFATRSPATNGPPINFGELVQVHDDRDVVQATPDDLPVIDIHSL